MAKLDVVINNRSYSVACEDGQEERLQALARAVDQKVGELARAVGQIGDARLLVMASLLIADELDDLRVEMAERERQTTESLNGLAERVEGVVRRLEAS